MNETDPHTVWKEQPMISEPVSLDRIKSDAQRLQRRIVIRNGLEYAACVLVLGVFGYYIVAFPTPLMRAGSVLTMVGTLVVAWQMHRRASRQPPPGALGDQAWLPYQRAQLIRQRDALRSAWLWYVAPFVPGMIVFRMGVEWELPPDGPFARGWAANLTIAAVLLGVAAWNAWGARQLQKRIEGLEG